MSLHLLAIDGVKRNDKRPDDINPLVEVGLTSSKGLGVFATQDIKPGALVLSESPLLVLLVRGGTSQHVLRKVASLSPSDLDDFYNLSHNKNCLNSEKRKAVQEACPAKQYFRQCPEILAGVQDAVVKIYLIIETNAIAMGSEHIGVFLMSSRINHSCTPNAHANYNPVLGKLTVYAIKDIKAGEELVTGYIDCAHPVGYRSEKLHEAGFNCNCDVCKTSAPGTNSEERRDRLEDLGFALAAYDGKEVPGYIYKKSLIPQNQTQALARAEESITLLRQEGLVGMCLTSMYRQCSKYSLQLGMVEKAKAYGMKELDIERCCLGTETEYMNEGSGDGNAEAWIRHVEATAERDQVRIRMCEKRFRKEAQRAEKKAAKKAAKGEQ